MASHRPVPFEWLEHTADVAVAVTGADPAEVYERIALVAATLIVGDSLARPAVTHEVEVEGDDRIERLVSLAGEVVYLWEVEAFVPASAEVVEDGRRVRATLWGEAFDPARHRVEREVKAATYHGALFEPDGAGGWRAELLFDL